MMYYAVYRLTDESGKSHVMTFRVEADTPIEAKQDALNTLHNYDDGRSRNLLDITEEVDWDLYED